MQVLQEFQGLNDDSLAKMALGFGGGIARRQSECGALVAGVMALGLKYGAEVTGERAPEVDAARQKVGKESGELLDAFEAAFGTTNCRKLTGHDFSKPGGNLLFRADAKARARCREYVAFVVKHLTS